MIIEIIRMAVGVLLDLALLGLSVMALGIAGFAVHVVVGTVASAAKEKIRKRREDER